MRVVVKTDPIYDWLVDQLDAKFKEAIGMGTYDIRKCPCGSGLDSSWQHDARGIPMFRSCANCDERKKKGMRQDVLTNPNYEADEPIYDEWGF